jgi:hypothetical protein
VAHRANLESDPTGLTELPNSGTTEPNEDDDAETSLNAACWAGLALLVTTFCPWVADSNDHRQTLWQATEGLDVAVAVASATPWVIAFSMVSATWLAYRRRRGDDALYWSYDVGARAALVGIFVTGATWLWVAYKFGLTIDRSAPWGLWVGFAGLALITRMIFKLGEACGDELLAHHFRLRAASLREQRSPSQMTADEATHEFIRGELTPEAWNEALAAIPGPSTHPYQKLYTEYENSDWDEAELRRRAEALLDS